MTDIDRKLYFERYINMIIVFHFHVPNYNIMSNDYKITMGIILYSLLLYYCFFFKCILMVNKLEKKVVDFNFILFY